MWIDRLRKSGQTWWQALPLGPTGYSHSPYHCLSSFAGNGLLISPEFLIQDGLLRQEECPETFPSGEVDYSRVIPFKHGLLRAAWTRFHSAGRKEMLSEYEEFCQSRSGWLEDYALFRALKIRYMGAPYQEWPAVLVRRVPSAIAEARRSLADEIDMVRVAQFLLYRQAKRLKGYARSQGVRLIGDLPFFVAPDSADVWSNPELFLVNENHRPQVVGGVPPDYFSAKGQLWGNPVYDWKAHQQTGYKWWLGRLRALLAHVDVIRLDHFRAFVAAWHVPAEASTAETGEWVPGPGADFFVAVQKEFGTLPFIAEDLGLITQDVSDLRDRFGIPGTRVLQFAFNGDAGNPHLPENFPTNTVVYTGTHDNPTSTEWWEMLSRHERQDFCAYLHRQQHEIGEAAPEMIRLAWSSRAALAITPLQDLLNLGGEARMNVPGEPAGNWRWRADWRMLSGLRFQWLAELTGESGRAQCVPAAAREVSA
jgi:4-alpha-glucanotransferase